MNLKDYDEIFFFQILIQRRNTIIYELDAIASCGWSLKITWKSKSLIPIWYGRRKTMKQIEPLWLKNKLWTSYVLHITIELAPLCIDLFKIFSLKSLLHQLIECVIVVSIDDIEGEYLIYWQSRLAWWLKGALEVVSCEMDIVISKKQSYSISMLELILKTWRC